MAAREVFNLGELLLMIITHLDDLSLVRIQRVNKLCQWAIRDTLELQRRLCSKRPFQTVIDPTRFNLPNGLKWSPFLEWFSMHGLIDSAVKECEGPYNDTMMSNVMAAGTICCLLPHALRAARNSRSSIHSMLVTSQPVSAARLRLVTGSAYSMECETFYITNLTGVTLGDVLGTWQRLTEKQAAGVPVCLWLPQVNERGFSGVHARLSKHLRRMDSINNLLMPGGGYCHLMECCDWTRGRCELAREWYKLTVNDGKKWYKVSMLDQNKTVREVLQKQKALIPRTRQRWKGHAGWPALAIRGPEDGGEKVQSPYTVDFACGIAFNRLE